MKELSYIVAFAIAAFISCAVADPARAAVSPSRYSAASYLVQVNGHTYLQKNPNLRLAPASLTKIMTALVVMEKCNAGEIVTVSRGAARETGSRIGLRYGQRFRVHDLLAATLIASANDACRALADHTAGSQEAFVAQMNAKAKSLGLEDTRFTNACGHDHRALYSSAHDLAILAEHALRVPLFADLVSRRSMSITTINGERTYHFRNKNRLIGRYRGAFGVKTGTTPNAGQCLVALAKREDKRVLLVLMRSRNRWSAAPAMLDAAFAVRTSAMRMDVEGGENEALPEGTVVRNQKEARLREHDAGSAERSWRERHPGRATAVQRHAHHRKRLHKRR